MGKQRKTKRRRALIAARSATVAINDYDKTARQVLITMPTFAPEPMAVIHADPDETTDNVYFAPTGDSWTKIAEAIATAADVPVEYVDLEGTVRADKPVPFSDRLKDAYRQHDGLITDDIVSMFPDVPRSSITARISDLKKRGLIVSPNVHRDDKQGRPVDVYFWAGE